MTTTKRKTISRRTPAAPKEQVVLRRIVSSFDERQSNHRGDFETCPHCYYEMEPVEWEKAATILILEPRMFRAGSIAIMTECPQCFEASWVHERYSAFHFGEWPDGWQQAVKRIEDANKLKALRDWGKGICHQCRHLESGTVEFHAWRHCVKGCGPPETTCDRFEV